MGISQSTEGAKKDYNDPGHSEPVTRTPIPSRATAQGSSSLSRPYASPERSSVAHPSPIGPKINEWIDKAFEAKRAGNHSEAIRYFTKVLTTEPNQSIALLYRGQSHEKQENHSLAVKDYERCLTTLDPGFNKTEELERCLGFAYSKLVKEKFRNNEFDEAIALAKKSVRYLKRPIDQSYALYYAALSCEKLNDLESATKNLEKATQLNPEIKFILNLGKIYEKQNLFEKAVQCYCKASSAEKNEFFIKSQSFCYKKLIESSPSNRRWISEYGHFLNEHKAALKDKKWFVDDQRWFGLVQKNKQAASNSAQGSTSRALVAIPAVHLAKNAFERGEYEYKKIVLEWDIEDFQRVDPLTPLKLRYSHLNQYYDAMLPLILEESKATLRQGYADPENALFLLQLKKEIVFSRNEGEINRAFVTNTIPTQYLESSQANLALWIHFKDQRGNIIYSCLGLATVFDEETQIGFLCDEGLDALARATAVEARYLGCLITHERMFSVCQDKPSSLIATQMSSAQLIPWETSYPDQPIQKCDPSQKRAILSFLASSQNSLCLLQGPPGTGKTSTVTALLKECARRRLRVLVAAPSNKAVQEIADRFLKESPQIKMILAGVKEKIPPHLQDIFGSEFFKNAFYKIKEATDLFLTTQGIRELLSSKSNIIKQDTLLQPFQAGVSLILKFFDDRVRDLEVLGSQLLICHQQFTRLSKEDKKAWLMAINKKPSQEVRVSESVREIEKSIQQLQESFERVVIKCRDSQESELFLLDHSDVVFSSLSVCGRAIMQRMQNTFDVLIIDEAGQSMPAETLIPLRFEIHKALLVGDPMQLPATTLSDTAEKTRFAQSTLGNLLIDNQAPHVMLNFQYRMHPEIRQFPSARFYNNQLQDGHTIPARESRLAVFDGMGLFPYGVIDIRGKDAKYGESHCNEAECQFISALVKKLKSTKQDLDIGVISFYRGQVIRLQSAITDRKNVLISTVDGFQGGECDLIIISCVRSNPFGTVGFSKNLQRLNVALTRARHGLVVVGDLKTLGAKNHALSDLINDAIGRRRVFSPAILNEPKPVPQKSVQKGKEPLRLKDSQPAAAVASSSNAQVKTKKNPVTLIASVAAVQQNAQKPKVASNKTGNEKNALGVKTTPVANAGGTQQIMNLLPKTTVAVPQTDASSSAGTRVIQPPIVHPKFKTVTCRFFQKGDCEKGERCTYIHAENQSQKF